MFFLIFRFDVNGLHPNKWVSKPNFKIFPPISVIRRRLYPILIIIF
jgi:hypothetical protein